MAGNENFFQHTKETNIIHKPQTTRPQLYVKYTTRKLKKFPTNIKNEKGTYREKERKKLLTFSHVFRKRQNYLFEVGAERTTASIETRSCADYFRKFVFVSGSRRRQSKSSLLKVPTLSKQCRVLVGQYLLDKRRHSSVFDYRWQITLKNKQP